MTPRTTRECLLRGKSVEGIVTSIKKRPSRRVLPTF
jgi:hypothetical protein